MSNRSRQLAGVKKREKKRLYDHLWAKTSREFRHGKLCALCTLLHRITPATCTDHIYPHGGDKTLFWDERNWQALCDACHNHKTARESPGMRNGEMHPGYPVTWRQHPDRYVVTGLPATGKTTWWQEHFTERPVKYCDLMWGQGAGVHFDADGQPVRIWDMDIEARKLGFSVEWARPQCQTYILLEARKEFLAGLGGVDPWVYVSTWLKDAYRVAAQHHATLVCCHVDEQLRKARLMARQSGANRPGGG